MVSSSVPEDKKAYKQNLDMQSESQETGKKSPVQSLDNNFHSVEQFVCFPFSPLLRQSSLFSIVQQVPELADSGTFQRL